MTDEPEANDESFGRAAELYKLIGRLPPERKEQLCRELSAGTLNPDTVRKAKLSMLTNPVRAAWLTRWTFILPVLASVTTVARRVAGEGNEDVWVTRSPIAAAVYRGAAL